MSLDSHMERSPYPSKGRDTSRRNAGYPDVDLDNYSDDYGRVQTVVGSRKLAIRVGGML